MPDRLIKKIFDIVKNNQVMRVELDKKLEKTAAKKHYQADGYHYNKKAKLDEKLEKKSRIRFGSIAILDRLIKKIFDIAAFFYF